jgi:hypothetical protein
MHKYTSTRKKINKPLKPAVSIFIACCKTRTSLWHQKLLWWHLKFLPTLLLLVHETSEMREKKFIFFLSIIIFCFITAFLPFSLIAISFLIFVHPIVMPFPVPFSFSFTLHVLYPILPFLYPIYTFISFLPYSFPTSFICSSYHHPSLVS